MKISVISWEEKVIREYETDYVRYDEDGIAFNEIDKNYQRIKKIPYNEFLGIKEI